MRKRKCSKCRQTKPLNDDEFSRHPNGKFFKTCKTCRGRKHPAGRSPNDARWIVEHDPTGHFKKGAKFGKKHFDGTRLMGYWPNRSVWYNRVTDTYYHIEQQAVPFKKIRMMKQFVRVTEEQLEKNDADL